MTRSSARGAGVWGAAAVLPSAGAPLYFVLPEPWGALLWFYLFLAAGTLAGSSLAVHGQAGQVALRFGVAFSLAGAVLPFSLLPAEGPALVASTAAAWGLALGASAGLGAFLSAPRLAQARSRLGTGLRAGASFLAGGGVGGAAATLLVAALPPHGYFAAWAVGLIAACAIGGGLFGRRST